MAAAFTDIWLEITVTGEDMSDAEKIHVTLKQGATVIDTTGAVLDGNVITARFPPVLSGRLKNGEAELAMNWIDRDGDRRKVDCGNVTVEDNILKRWSI